ncbi:MAG TPA: hypothetical protein VFH03_15580 [Actinoplanes sp.]|nr:hypothetical protein [Actinoplanes sp.]
MIDSHGVVLTTAVAALACLPFVVAVVMRSPDIRVRRAWVRRSRAHRPLLRAVDRGDIDTAPLAVLPPLEQVAAELHRLARERNTGTTYGSKRWLTARATAYDEWLQVACRHLDVRHHLPTLDGLDRDLERLRIEAELNAAGLRLPR